MRLVSDIKPEEENTRKKLKEETKNNYRLKFDKFKE